MHGSDTARWAVVLSGRNPDRAWPATAAHGKARTFHRVLVFPALGMPNVYGLISPQRILSDICSVVRNSLKGPAS